jgi:hypothetical protein
MFTAWSSHRIYVVFPGLVIQDSKAAFGLEAVDKSLAKVFNLGCCRR